MLPPEVRLLLASAALSTWILLLFTGWTLGGAVHLLLLVVFFLVPWKNIPRS